MGKARNSWASALTTLQLFFRLGDTLVTLPTPREELFVRAARSINLQLSIEAVRRAYQIVDFNNKYSSISVRDRTLFYSQYNAQRRIWDFQSPRRVVAGGD